MEIRQILKLLNGSDVCVQRRMSQADRRFRQRRSLTLLDHVADKNELDRTGARFLFLPDPCGGLIQSFQDAAAKIVLRPRSEFLVSAQLLCRCVVTVKGAVEYVDCI